jgi:hypothetical protein
MLVSIEGFGRIWEQRVGKDPSDPWRFSARAAFYNTTGVSVGENGTIKHRWKLGGKVRFQGGSAFDSARVENNLGRVFECDEPEQRFTWLQMCCKRRLPQPEIPDWFLFRVTSEQIGWMNFKSDAAKSPGTFLLSYSAEAGDQEALILMKPGVWVAGRNGQLIVDPDPRRPWRARLRFSSYSESEERNNAAV